MSDNQNPVFSSDPATTAPMQEGPAVLPPVEASVSSVAPTYQPPKPKTPILPLILGFLIVIVVATAVGIAYYKNKMTISSSKSPSPSVVASVLPSPEPSSSPSASPSTSPKSSAKSSAKPTAKPTTTTKTTPTPTSTPTPTPTPVSLPTLDLRFGNPSANIKQTIDEGKGDGRVINREFVSIQVGEFDEVPTAWNSRITICYHIVSNEDVNGKDIKFSLKVDDKDEVSDNLGQYNKLEAGRTYDWCHDVTTSTGSHSAKLSLNTDKSLKESNYNNDLGRIDWVGLTDKIAPNYTLTGPTQDGDKTCLSLAYLSDNVTKNSDLKIEERLGAEDWKSTTSTTYCKTGTAGTEYTYSVKVTDSRGNVNEQKKTFMLY